MEKIEIKKKQGSIVEALRDAILSGNIPAETEMTQNELAQSLGVSRMPVREALIILEYQGLIRRLPNNHVRVVPQTRDYISSLFRMCSDLSAPLLGKMEHPEELPERDPEFHRAIYQQCEFAFQRKTLESLTEIYIAYAAARLSVKGTDAKEALKVIKEAVLLKDEQSIQQALGQYYAILLDGMMTE